MLSRPRTYWAFLALLLLVWASFAPAYIAAVQSTVAPNILPEPRPKLLLSTKDASPLVVASPGTVTYTIVLRNTGATSAPDTMLYDPFPTGVTYNDDAQASEGTLISSTVGLTWTGEVGFDSSVYITFSVAPVSTYTGRLTNTTFVTQPAISDPLTLTAICTVTDEPILRILKKGEPSRPGAEKPLTYTLRVINVGQPTESLPITVTDAVPTDTTLLAVGGGGITDTLGHITWTHLITLPLGGSTSFTFSVMVDDVPSGTVLLNEGYAVTSTLPGVGDTGAPYTLTVFSPILLLTKETEPDPPGSNRTMVYTLTLYNRGSLATDLVITDTVPDNITYITGGTYLSTTNTISWTWPQLATRERAHFTYSAYIGDLPGGTLIVNDQYAAWCSEGITVAGRPLTSTIEGPIFANSFKWADPIAKKPGGGTSLITYTIGIRNTGAGNALDVDTVDELWYVSIAEVIIEPPTGTFFWGNCGAHCDLFTWEGDVPHDSQITITLRGSSSYAGVPVVTNTAVISDNLTAPFSATTRYLVTHDARLNVYKDAPTYIGPNEVMTYTFSVVNSAFATTGTAVLTDVLPAEVTFITASHGGALMSGTEMVSWTLPIIGTGADLTRSLTVEVGDWPSGTQIVDWDFGANCTNCALTDVVFLPVTTTVQFRDLSSSYKRVTPKLSYPGPAVLLTYTLHLVNPTGLDLQAVEVTDYLPWAQSTYNRDAVASAGTIFSDIVHLDWVCDVGGYTTETLTLTVVADPWYKGGVTNTAVITHASLSAPVTVTAEAWITDEPVLRLTKLDSPDPVAWGGELRYTLYLRNLGQMATNLVLSDTVPAYTSYVPGSATRGGTPVGDAVVWDLAEIDAASTEVFSFRVLVEGGEVLLNDAYSASCEEGVWAYGPPVETRVIGGNVFLPVVFKNWQ
jgi:uncharacterized repeat protein (TIGR01451 family)